MHGTTPVPPLWQSQGAFQQEGVKELWALRSFRELLGGVHWEVNHSKVPLLILGVSLAEVSGARP